MLDHNQFTNQTPHSVLLSVLLGANAVNFPAKI